MKYLLKSKLIIIILTLGFNLFNITVKGQIDIDSENLDEVKEENVFVNFFMKELWSIDSTGYLGYRTKIQQYIYSTVKQEKYTFDITTRMFGEYIAKVGLEDQNYLIGYPLYRDSKLLNGITKLGDILAVMVLYFDKNENLYKCVEWDLTNDKKKFKFWNTPIKDK